MFKSITSPLVILLLTVMFGCAKTGDKWVSVDTDDISISYGSNKIEYKKNYTVNEKMTARIGDEIISVHPYVDGSFSDVELLVYNKIKVYFSDKVDSEPYVNLFNLDGKIYEANEKLLFDEANEKANTGKVFYLLPYIDKNYNEKVPLYALLVSEDGHISNKAIYYYGYKMLYIPTKLSISHDTVKFSGVLRVIDNAPRWSIVYTGKNNISLNVTYREYTGKYPSYQYITNGLTYESNAKQIQFKNFIMQINKSTNEIIDYTIVKDGIENER